MYSKEEIEMTKEFINGQGKAIIETSVVAIPIRVNKMMESLAAGEYADAVIFCEWLLEGFQSLVGALSIMIVVDPNQEERFRDAKAFNDTHGEWIKNHGEEIRKLMIDKGMTDKQVDELEQIAEEFNAG